MRHVLTYRLFYGSLVLGILLWLLSFSLIPVEVVEDVNIYTVGFICLCYIAMVFGFIAIPNRIEKNEIRINNPLFIKYLIMVITISFVLRWIDLFYVRELSFFNTPIENRRLSFINNTNSNVLLLMAAVLKSLYFFPFVLTLHERNTLRIYLICAILLLGFVVPEAILFGTRKPFFDLTLIIIISVLVSRRVKVGVKSLGLFFAAALTLMAISYFVLIGRESPRAENQNVYKHVLEGRYNDLLRPKDKTIAYIQNEDSNSFMRAVTFITLQTGQYINHGFFEFNHIYNKSELPVSYGMYVFNPFFKFAQRMGLAKGIEYTNPSPRKIVYLTTFGSFYIDFRWFATLVFFLLGSFQRHIYNNSKVNTIYAPLLIYLAIFNLFLPIFNYMKGAGIYPIVGIFIAIVSYRFLSKLIYEKSTSS
ncbi:hypothetical protein J4050_00575 [Winogradskyella sp. DF17]|uniref:Oligosaccharide repeat unit polymerase n=1 Tax=Winogradskyella pelagia TaxID=2819984 RepID=A0ABS3SYC4_9FLAO|nr:hypothetical protein [Winogradskyella sp. DF17]MBO3115219.1 hypothetical protein [Winogradskyella sp. DF17]